MGSQGTLETSSEWPRDHHRDVQRQKTGESYKLVYVTHDVMCSYSYSYIQRLKINGGIALHKLQSKLSY